MLNKNNIRKILVIHTHGGLGDLLLSTPVFHSLKEEFPEAHLTVLVQNSFKDVVTGNPKIDRIITMQPQWKKGLSGFREMLTTVSREKYDMVMVLWSTSLEAHLMFLAGIPIRVGQAGRLLYSFLFTHQVTRRSDTGDEETHWVENQLDFIRSLGIEPKNKSVFFHIPDDAFQYVDNLFKNEGITENDFLIGFHSTKGLSVDPQRWPVDKFASFAESLGEHFGGKLVFTGTPGEKEIVDIIRSKVKIPSISVAGRTDIKQAAAVIKRCNLYVCPDSGPMHIAAAVKTPVVGIYGLKEDFPKRWAPYDCPHAIIRLENIPCDKKCIKAECPSFSCYEAIPDEMVVKAADELVKSVFIK